MISFLQILAIVLAGLAALVSILFFVRLRWPAPVLWFIKLYASALSPWFVFAGVFIIIVGLTTGPGFISLFGLYVTTVFSWHFFRITASPGPAGNFEEAFGLHWENRIDKEQKKYFLPSRRILKLPVVAKPQLEQDIPFATIPGTDRKLLCDLWQPPANVKPSGLAFIYFHGSAFYILDKDFCTRPFFTHLAAQGHVVMDVAYRLAPETDLMGMVNDVKRAIVWMKENAGAFKIDPGRIVVGGGSAGGHLALLAAYTADDARFTPAELKGKDLSTCAVVSLYGSNDLVALYYHTNQHLTTRSIPGQPKKSVPTKMPSWIIRMMGPEYYRLGLNKGFENTGVMAHLLGGHPDECPETYALFSPAEHVHEHCPPTLLIHGEHDIMAPVESTCFLFDRLMEAKVPTVFHVLPQTEHAFDLILPKISPAAHTAIYDVERFLAAQTKLSGKLKTITEAFEEYEVSL